MTSQPKLQTNISQQSEGDQKLFQAEIALDAGPHSTLVINNLHHYLDAGHCSGSFLHVIPGFSEQERKFMPLDDEARQEIRLVVDKQFDEYAKVLSDHHLSVAGRHFVTDAENAEEGILKYTESQTPDLLILGMKETRRRKGWRISSTSYSIATHAPCSVVVFKNPAPQGQRLKVLFATDGSSYAEKAMEQLMRFLPRETTDIIVFSVVSVNYYVLPVVEPYVNYAPLEHAMQGEAIELMERTRKTFENAGFAVPQSFFNLGDPVDQILQETQKNQVDLIVMGSHGTGNRLTNWLLGSVSSKVLELSEASVAILR